MKVASMPKQKPTIEQNDSSDFQNEINIFDAIDLFQTNIKKILFFAVLITFAAGCLIFSIPTSYEVSGKLFSRTSLSDGELKSLIERSDLIARILTSQKLDNQTEIEYDTKTNILSKRSDSLDGAQSSFLLMSEKIETELTNLVKNDSLLTLKIIEKTNNGSKRFEESEGRFMKQHDALMNLEYISLHGNAFEFIVSKNVKKIPNALLILSLAFFGGAFFRFLGILFLQAKSQTKYQKSAH
jgi:hypothetical protein